MDLLLGACFDTVLALPPLAMTTQALELLVAFGDWAKKIKGNQADARRLVERVLQFQPALEALVENAEAMELTKGLGAVKSFLALVHAVVTYVDKYLEKTWWRGADRIANASKFSAAFGDFNKRVSQISNDLAAIVSICSLLHATAPAARRDEDIADTHSLLQSMFGSVLAEMESDNEASRADMQAIQADIEGNYAELMKVMLDANGHAPLVEAELAAVAKQQAQLLQTCEAKFDEIVATMQRLEEDIHGLVGGLDELRELVRNATQEKKRDGELKKLEIPASDITVRSKLSAGGFGEVHLGWYERNAVALKKVANNQGAELSEREVEGVENEVLLMHKVKNPNILLCYGMVKESLSITIVLELSPYGSCWDLVASSALFPVPGTLPPSLLIGWMCDLCFGVAHLHSKRVIHKDIKCQNLLVYAFPNRLRVKICDFGLARQSSGDSSAAGGGMTMAGGGTQAFMAPEQREGAKSSAKSDVFSIAMAMLQVRGRVLDLATACEIALARAL
jgi:hypothetical protein